ncbi:hypothetical protein [Paenibacillus azoreducens]|uniref:DUF1433 domain-containing protein n=1 Tax=Paenibacillus azoreducens TaxID=116718 RepID=A0A920CWD8_9BACL|nr:hypothetical protein [Paenibacillus azoreducens]GIO51462.1 hypothetical protein J34TS1_62270 [Paenibacillus azoreducens]
MWRIFRVIFSVILVISLLSGCMSKSQKKTIYNKAVPIAEQYMKDNYNTDVIISDNYQFLDPMNSEIVLNGHMVGDESATFSIGINHKTFKINNIIGSSEIMDRYVKPDQKNKSSTEDPKK